MTMKTLLVLAACGACSGMTAKNANVKGSVPTPKNAAPTNAAQRVVGEGSPGFGTPIAEATALKWFAVLSVTREQALARHTA